MKNLSKVIVALLSVVSLKSYAAETSADGSWVVADRYCEVGLNTFQVVAPNDRFKLGRDKMELNIVGSDGLMSATIDGQSFQQPFKVHAGDLMLSNPFSKEKIFYRIESDGSLILLTGNFGKGGTCPEGNSILVTKFTRH